MNAAPLMDAKIKSLLDIQNVIHASLGSGELGILFPTLSTPYVQMHLEEANTLEYLWKNSETFAIRADTSKVKDVMVIPSVLTG
jgi:hypothetical protein